MYEDSAGYIHFKTNEIHVWGKQLLDPAIATDHMRYMVDKLGWNFNKYKNPLDANWWCKTRRGQVQMSSYGGDIIYAGNASQTIEMNTFWRNYFNRLCPIMQHRFNNFLFNHYPNGHFEINSHNDNYKGWVNKITPFATLVFTEVDRELIFTRFLTNK